VVADLGKVIGSACWLLVACARETDVMSWHMFGQVK
jgi:hypothetical protein